ncbi:MAG: hypothetical protein U0174_05895 [Polyangiaceae bacterium]
MKAKGRALAAMAAFTLSACGCPNSRTPRIDTIFPSGYTAPDAQASAAAYARLRGLAGDWSAKLPNGKLVYASYREVANGSAVVETFMTSSGDQTLTIFHRDGAGLMLTHYCAQGNQPRLGVVAITGSEIHFRYIDASNLNDKQDLLAKLSIVFRGVDNFEKHESYRLANGAVETTVLSFARVRHPID